jgi:small-conductance mechanosensitive channel
MDIWVTLGSSALITLSIALSVLIAIWVFVKVSGSRVSWLAEAYHDIRGRLGFFVITSAAWISVLVARRPEDFWWLVASQSLLVLLILSGGFLLQKVVNHGVLHTVARFEKADQSDANVRRITTQLSLLGRIANVTIAILAIGFALFTFPAAQGIGAGLLASAGVLSVIAGLAAQSVLGNVIAGMQLAFSNAIRVGDVVVVEGEWGTIGEITLSYVVVHIWDERRLIVPSTHFTSKSFETWTRQNPQVLGTVFLDVGWGVPLDKVRKEFDSFLRGNPLWDKRVSSVLVTDARGGFVQLRFVISAANSSAQWDLRCAVREHMVAWFVKNYPETLLVARVPGAMASLPRKTRQRPPS